MNSQQTGFMQNQQTGYPGMQQGGMGMNNSNMGMRSQPTGMPSGMGRMQSQQTGMPSMGMQGMNTGGMQPMMTGMPQRPQQTGMSSFSGMNTGSGFSSSGMGMSSNPTGASGGQGNYSFLNAPPPQSSLGGGMGSRMTPQMTGYPGGGMGAMTAQPTGMPHDPRLQMMAASFMPSNVNQVRPLNSSFQSFNSRASFDSHSAPQETCNSPIPSLNHCNNPSNLSSPTHPSRRPKSPGRSADRRRRTTTKSSVRGRAGRAAVLSMVRWRGRCLGRRGWGGRI